MKTLYCVIFDLDGTLADVTHRRHYVEGKTGKLSLAGFRPLFAVEDRNSVVKMWRDLGLTCMQVAEGNF